MNIRSVFNLHRGVEGSDWLVKVNVAWEFPSKLRYCLSYAYNIYDVISFISTTFIVRRSLLSYQYKYCMNISLLGPIVLFLGKFMSGIEMI